MGYSSRQMELLDAQLRDDPAAVRARVPRQLAAALDGSVDRQSVERAPLAWCLVALQYNKATVAKLGENMQVRRFVRYNLGEGIEKKTMNFADEVAEQMGKSV